MVIKASDITARAVRLAPCHRIVASRLPTIHLFERVADPADWEALYKLESMTNPRLREQAGEISLVPVADRVSGPNASVIMAPFTHLSPQGTRFTDGHFGAYYADSYAASQRVGRELRDAGSNGVAFESVRRPGGQCVAVFRPRLVQNVRQSVHLRYAWDGTSIAHVYEMRAINL